MKNFKKIISLFLCFTMIFNISFNSIANYNNIEMDNDTSKIEEQLKKDLGAEKAEEILHEKNIDYEKLENGYDAEIIDHDEDNIPDKPSNDDMKDETVTENENLEDAFYIDDDESLEIEKDINETTKKYDIESNNNDAVNLDVEETLDNLLNDKNTEEIENEIQNNENKDNSNIKNDIIATESEIEIVLKSTKSNADVYGEDTPWMWWYLTDDDTTIHYTSVEPASGGHSVSGEYISSIYDSLDKKKIKKAIFDNKIIALAGSWLFYKFENLEIIENLSNFDTSKVTDMYGMFSGCSLLTSVDVSNFNTSKVSGMSSMFDNCLSLTSINVSNFDTSEVTSMSSMFSGCSSLTSVDVSKFDISKVTDMIYMFRGCSSLTSVDVSSFDTTNVTSMYYMFIGCSSLTSVDVSKFDTRKVTNMGGMFQGCSSLISIDVSNFNTSNVTDMEFMFCGCSSLTSIDVSKFDTRKVTKMGGMFQGCSSLTSIDVSNFITSIVTDMSQMFYNCSSITNIDVSNFDTTNVTGGTYSGLLYMFGGCSSLVSIDVSSFNTENVLNTACMFYGCSNLEELDLSNFEFDNNQYFNRMFYGCKNLVKLDLSNFNTSSGVDFQYMFYNCNKLEEIDISSFDLSNSNNNEYFMYGLSSIKTMKISKSVADIINEQEIGYDWKEETGTTIYYYDNINNKTTIPNSAGNYVRANDNNRVTVEFNTDDGSYVKPLAIDKGGKVDEPDEPTKTEHIFLGWYNSDLNTEFDFTKNINENTTVYAKWQEVEKVTCFWYILNKNELHLSSTEPETEAYVAGQQFDIIHSPDNTPWKQFSNYITKVVIDNKLRPTIMYYWFYNLSELEEIININNIDTSNNTNFQGTFQGCKSLKTIDVSSFDTRNVTGMTQMFSGCSSLTSIDVSNFNTSKVTGMHGMFSRCSSLTSIDVSNFNTSKVTDMANMFFGCSSLTGIDVSNFNTGKVTNMSQMFLDCSSLTSIDVSNFDTSKVTSMSGMFSGCSSLTSIDVSNFNNSNVTDMSSMFSSCSALTSLDLRNFDTSKVTNMQKMFSSCSSLTSVDVSNFNTSNVTDMSSMFSSCSALTSLDLSKFDTSKVANMNRMFLDCSSLTSIDLSNFDTDNVTNMGSMFWGCSSLTTIYANEKFNTNNITEADNDHSSSFMFLSCTSLVGGNGTTYDSEHTDKEYARVDGGPTSATPGYFTYKESSDPAVKTWTVSFDTKNLINIQNQTIENNNKVNKPANPQVDGYKFINWYKDSEYTTIFDFDKELITKDTTIYGKFIKIHTVTFVTNNKGVTGADTIPPVKVDDGSNVSRPTNDPTAQNYEFLGWYSEPECTNEFDFDEPITADTEIYADWRAVVTYTITFNMNSHGTQVQPLYVVENKYATEPSKPTAEGYSFKYWYQNDENVAFDFKNTKITDNINLTAKWEENKYTVTYDLNGGKFVDGYSATTERSYSSSLDMPAADKVEKTGHTFAGWTKDRVGGDAITTIAANTAENIKIYANWTANVYNITYHLNGSTGSGYILGKEGQDTVTDTYTYGIAKSLPTNVVADIATMSFAGWYENDNFTGTKTTATTKTTIGDKNYYAKYEKKAETYTITFRPGDGGTGSMAKQIVPAGKQTKLNYNTFTNTKKSYYFSHWSGSDGKTYYDGGNITATSNLTLTANWYKATGGGGGGGGGGSGTAAPQNNQNASNEVKTTQAQTTSKNESNTKQVLATNAAWVTDQTTGGFKLNIINEQGLPVPATNGFYSLNSVVTQLINNVPVQVPVSDTYFFDAAGNMVTGWVQTVDNKWYFFDNTPNANMGKMTTGWREVQGSYYYFNTDGTMMTNGITPDGYTIGADGKWVR